MWKKIAIGGAVAAAIVGIGTAAVATSGSTSGSPSPTSTTNSSTDKTMRDHPKLARLLARRAVHGQVVTQNPDTKAFVTHDIINGTVTAVSSTSITVKAADNTSETFVVNSSTKVVTRTPGQKGSAKKGAITDVKSGDHVAVVGTGAGTGPFTATGIIDGLS